MNRSLSLLLLLRGAASHVYTPLPHPHSSQDNKEPHLPGEGLVDHNGVNRIWWMDGDGDDHDEDKSDEEAFHPNYIPQCFFIGGSRGWFCSFTFSKAGEVELFLLCNCFILLLIFFYFLLLTLHGGFAGDFFRSRKNGTLVVLLLSGALSLSLCVTTPSWSLGLELESVVADGGFRFRWGLGCRGTWREEMDSNPWAVPLVYPHLFTGSTEKREAKWREECWDFYFNFYTVFLQIVSWGGGPGRNFSALDGAWHRFGLAGQEVSWSHPSGFTVCCLAVALAATASPLLHHYVSKETIHRKKNLLTKIAFLLFTFVKKKKMEPNFEWMFLCLRNTRWVIKRVFFFPYSRCALTAPCGAAQFLRLLFLHR